METNLKNGQAKGRAKGCINTILEMCSELYPNQDCSWVKELDAVRLKYIQKLLLKQLSYEEFHETVLKFRN